MKIPPPDAIVAAADLQRVHFIGIGGAGLSAIARLMLAQGVTVSGSDGNRLGGA
ncbi:MAG: Mur ligase domain-containing protein [Nocardioides sp.]